MLETLRRFLMRSLLVLNVAVPLSVIAALMFSTDRGFGITDEGYYVLSAWNPKDDLGALSAFGHYLNLFVPIIGKDIAALRLIGLLALVSVGGIFSWQLAKYCSERLREKPTRDEFIVLLVGGGTAILTYYAIWLLTPSYRQFSVTGSALVASGGILAVRNFGKGAQQSNEVAVSISGIVPVALFIGLGGFLGFIGRPTTALALGFVVALWLAFVVHRRHWISIIAAAAIVSVLFLLTSLWWFEGGVTAFIGRLEEARALVASLNVGHTFTSSLDRAFGDFLDIRLRLLDTPIRTGYLIITVGFVLAFAIGKLAKKSSPTTWRSVWVVSLVAGLVAFTSVWAERSMPKLVANVLGQIGLELVLLLLIPLLMVRIISRIFSRGGRGEWQAENIIRLMTVRTEVLLLALFLVAAALATAFGSASTITNASREAFFLYIAAAVLLLLEVIPRQLRLTRMLVLSLVASSTFFILLWASENPFRLPQSIQHQTQKVRFLDSSTVLKVDPPTALWVKGLIDIANASSWKPGTYIIDLTGASPGAAVVLSGRAPSTPWLAGGFDGSEAYVRLALSMAEHDVLKSAWVLTAPRGSLKIPPDVLTSVGLSFPDDYTIVGSVTTEHRYRSSHRNEEQFLWRPNDK